MRKIVYILYLCIANITIANENLYIKLHFHKNIIKKNPPYLKSIIDPIYKTKITRITDFKVFHEYIRHRYSKNQPFNCDSTLIKLETKWLLDAKNYKPIKKFPKNFHYTTSIWSHKNPYKLYIFKENGTILSYDIKNSKTTILMRIKNYERVTLGPNEGNIDINDRFAALACKKNNDLDVLIVDLYEKRVISKRKFKNRWGKNYNPSWFDWISVSQSGKYTIILWNKKVKDKFQSGDVKVYDTKTLLYLHTLYKYGNHGDLCFDSKGEEVYVQFAGDASLNMYRLKDGKKIPILKNLEFEIGGARHISCRNYKQKGWCYISTQKNSLILGVKLDRKKEIKYIANHHSTQLNYKKCAMATPNPTGDKIIFASDWGNYKKDVVYDYIAEKSSSGGDLHSHSSKEQYYRR